MKKKTNKFILGEEGGFVFSTNPDFKPTSFEDVSEELAPNEQKIYIELKRLKGNKLVTVVTGYQGSDENRKELGKRLKMKCGTGGSVVDDEIMVQGDMVKKVTDLLIAEGFRPKRKGG